MFLSADIEDLPPTVQEKLFDEVLDRDVQKGEILTYFSNLKYHYFTELCVSVRPLS